MANYQSYVYRIARLAEAEQMFYSYRAKCAYLRNVDRNTKFFHDLVKRNNRQNTIVALQCESGESTTSLQEVASDFVAQFRQLLGTSIPRTEPNFDWLNKGSN